MMRSLYSAISGLKNHQIKMDVIGNNVANVNTVGFKRSRTDFTTMLSQTIRGASAPMGSQGGTNAIQVGLGSSLGAVTQIMTTGSEQSTGKDTDMMIRGSGFFVLNNNGQAVYSRNGSFTKDKAGNLVDPSSGATVMGYMWGTDDTTPVDFTKLVPIKFNLGEALPQPATIALPAKPATFPGNGWTSATTYSDPALVGSYIDPADMPADATLNTGTGTITFTDSAAADAAITAGADLPLNHTFSVTYPTFTGTSYTDTSWIGAKISNLPAGATFDSTTGTLSFASQTDADDAATAGVALDMTWTVPTMDSFSTDEKGVITGVYSNGIATVTHKIGQIAVASFANDAGLQNIGGSYYTTTNNSGIASIGAAGTEGRGGIATGMVEMSNVDLSQEFTDMIVAQRGFQANSRVITVSDTLLQELIDLKRQ